MLEHLKIFGLIINLMVGSVISLYVFQVYKIYKFKYLLALGYYTLLFNLAFLILFFYSYLSVNVSDELFNASFSSYQLMPEYFISLFIIGLLYYAYKIYLGFGAKKFTLPMRWLFYGLIIFLTISYALGLVINNESYNKWLSILFNYFFENLLLLELVILILLISKRSGEVAKRKIERSFGSLYLLRYVVFLALYLFIITAGYNENMKVLFGFSSLLIINLLPLLWIQLFFIPYTKQIKVIPDTDKLDAYSQKYRVSQREKEILKLLLEGKSNKEISNLLFISYSTVKNHIYNLFQKLSLNSRFELISSFNLFNQK